MAITGLNGCGKSTLLKTLIGRLPIVSGSIQIGDWRRTQHRETGSPQWKNFGYVPQNKHAGGGINASVREVVQSGLLGEQRWWLPFGSRTQVDRALEAVNLRSLARKQYANLSGGQMQRTLIARALVRRPQIWLLDEPLTGLDPESRQTLIQILQQELAEGATMLIVLHEVDEFQKILTHELHLEYGQVAYFGHPDGCPLPTMAGTEPEGLY